MQTALFVTTLLAAMAVRSVGQESKAAGGYTEVCLETASDRAVEGTFEFQLGSDEQKHGAPAGACTPAIPVNAGRLTVRAIPRPGALLTDIKTLPAGRLIDFDLAKETAIIRIVPGDVSTQTVVIFTKVAVTDTPPDTTSSAAVSQASGH